MFTTGAILFIYLEPEFPEDDGTGNTIEFPTELLPSRCLFPILPSL